MKAPTQTSLLRNRWRRFRKGYCEKHGPHRGRCKVCGGIGYRTP